MGLGRPGRWVASGSLLGHHDVLHNYRAEVAVCMSRKRTPCPLNPFIPLSPLPQVSHVSSRGSENEPREGDHKEASGLQKGLGAGGTRSWCREDAVAWSIGLGVGGGVCASSDAGACVRTRQRPITSQRRTQSRLGRGTDSLSVDVADPELSLNSRERMRMKILNLIELSTEMIDQMT